jgi:hypothetical protein
MKRLVLLAFAFFTLIVANAHGHPLLDGWVKYDSPQGGFVILVPTTPAISNDQHSVASKAKYFTTTIQWWEVSSGFSMERGRDEYVARLKGRLIEERKVSIGGYPGYEWKVEWTYNGKDQLSWTRACLTANKVYLLQFFGPRRNFNNQAMIDCANKYFDSFRLGTGK